jgi:hypothetical protein
LSSVAAGREGAPRGGYGISYGFGDAIYRLSGHAQFIMLGAAGVLTLALIVRRVVRSDRVEH